MKIARLWVPVCLAGILVGCGQKGPLVHPDSPKHKKVLPSPRAPAPLASGVPGAPPPAGTPPADATTTPSDAPPRP